MFSNRGHSCIITSNGKVLNMSELVSGNDIIIADLRINVRLEASK